MAKIEARRQLDDLFMKGVEIRFGKDSETEEVWGKVGPFEDDNNRRIKPESGVSCMFVRPPNPVQREQAMRNAQARRSRALVRAKREKDSEEHLTIMAFLVEMSDDILLDYVLMSNSGERMADAEREVMSREEWKDMTSYQDAARQFGEMTPDELEGNAEWEAFQELDDRFGDQIKERELQLADAERDALLMLLKSGRDKVEEQALKRRAEFTGTQAFIAEYERQMQYYSVRDVDDPNMLWFAHVDDYSTADELVRETIAEALEPFINEGSTAKNSPRAASGSDSSVLPEKPETSESSTPETPSE